MVGTVVTDSPANPYPQTTIWPHAHCRWYANPPKIADSMVITIYGTSAGSLISASLTPPILPRAARSNPITERARRRETDQRTDCEREVGVPDFVWREEVGRRRKNGRLGQVEEEKQVCGSRDHQPRPEDNGVEEALYRREGVAKDEAFPAGIRGLEGHELAARRAAGGP